VDDDGGIDLAEEARRGGLVLGDDAIGVARSVALDVVEGGAEPVHHLHRQDRVEVFGAPVLFGGGDDARVEGAGGDVAADLAAGVQHGDHEVAVERRGAIDEQGLGGAADAGPAQLGIAHDGEGLVAVGGGLDEDVVDAFKMGKDRHPRFGLHPRHQASAAARHDDVDRTLEPRQHRAHSRAVAHGDGGDRRLGEADGAQAVHQAGMDEPGRMEALGAAAQDGDVARFQAQGAGVRGHGRTALVDDADDPERHGDALDGQAARRRQGGQNPAHRIGEGGNRLEAGRNIVDALGVEAQPVDEGCGRPAGRGLHDVTAVGRDDLVAAPAHGRGRHPKGFGAVGIRRKGQGPRGPTRLASKGRHDGRDVGLAAADELQLFHGHLIAAPRFARKSLRVAPLHPEKACKRAFQSP